MFINQVNQECGDIPMVLVQNKIDLVEDAKMSPWVVIFSIIITTLSVYSVRFLNSNFWIFPLVVLLYTISLLVLKWNTSSFFWLVHLHMQLGECQTRKAFRFSLQCWSFVQLKDCNWFFFSVFLIKRKAMSSPLV